VVHENELDRHQKPSRPKQPSQYIRKPPPVKYIKMENLQKKLSSKSTGTTPKPNKQDLKIEIDSKIK